MRIGILHYTLPPVIGGVERVIRDQAAALEALGHEVEMMTHTMERRRSVGIAENSDPKTTTPPPPRGPFLDPKRFIARHRHDLPHWQQDHVICFITWRLADSLPQEFIEKWMAQRKAWAQQHPRPWDQETELAYHQRFDRPFLDRLDKGYGACVLQRKDCSEAVEQAFHHFDGLRYHLLSYVIMPNHVHLLVRLHPDWPMEKVVQNWKERSAKSINAILNTQGSVWQKGYFDRLIRGEEHLDYVQRYIRQNPVKARLRGGFSLWSASLDDAGNADGMPTDRRRSMDVTGLDAILVHNVFTMPFDLAWTRELREMAAATPHIRWINWVHDVAAINPHYAHLPWSQPDHAQLSESVPNALNFTVSEARKQDYVRATGLPADQVHVIPNGLHLASLLGLTPRIADLRLWDHELVLIHPTRLIRRKNIELGLRVTAALRDAGCDVIYAVTGAPDPHQADGIAYHKELKTLTEELGITAQVLFLGEASPLSDDDVRSLYAAADALFFPSTGEGFGLPLLEAAAHRLTVFCSNLPVHYEVLGDSAQYFDTQSKPDKISAQIMQWHPSAIANHQRRHLWRRHEMVKICQEHLEPWLTTANQSFMTDPTSPSAEILAILEARHGDPFGFLGRQPKEGGGAVVRTLQPNAHAVTVVARDGSGSWPMQRVHHHGFYTVDLPPEAAHIPYDIELATFDGQALRSADPYSFGPLLGEQDLYFFCEGTHQRLWDCLGARIRTVDGVTGVQFAVWAPNAQRVSIIGDFNNWDGRINPMRLRIEGGVWEIFLPGIKELTHYKFEVLSAEGHLQVKSDPFAFYGQHGIQTASLVFDLDRYTWSDQEWMQKRAQTNLYKTPMSVYEVHLGSWKRVPEDGNRSKSYRELADDLIPYVKAMNFTHIELMPVAEHPFDGSWGYQITGYFAPTSRFGNPDEFREFVDRCHQAGIGVILDWVPGHFPKDAHGLAKFDGTALYEHADPRQGEHQDWGTLIFNYGRSEVKNFLVANALFWLEHYHIDGLRVDAVASMLYLDYSRQPWAWVPNKYGGRENLEAIDFMRDLNRICYERHPGSTIIAEESTAWPGVSRPTDAGGLGFGFKWNMGWMNDSLTYMQEDPIHRKYHHGEATFSMLYAYDENFILVISHDEVVHGKGSMINKMPGDRWQKFANLRMFYAWMWAHPGKKLLFMGSEFGQWQEWGHERSLDWHLFLGEEHASLQKLVRDLNWLYTNTPALHALDHEGTGFSWLDAGDADNSIFAFIRIAPDGEKVYCVINATPVPRKGYRVGVAEAGSYRELLNTDAPGYAGSGMTNPLPMPASDTEWQGQPWSIVIDLPPLGVVLLGR